MKVEHPAPGVFQLLHSSQEPDPYNKIVQSQCRGRDQRVTLYCCSRQWRSSYPTTCYFHLLSGPFRSVFLQYITSTISQYKPRPWRYCHQFTTTLTTTLFIKQCAVNAECYHCTNLTQWTAHGSNLRKVVTTVNLNITHRVSIISMELLHILDFNLHSTWDYGSCIGWQYCISTISTCEWIDLTEPQLYNTANRKHYNDISPSPTSQNAWWWPAETC